MHKHPSGMRGWVDLGSDVSWDDYGGRWGRRAPDGTWYIVEFTNMYDACGEADCKSTDTPQYLAEVKRVDLVDLPADTLASALRCVGLRCTSEGVVSDSGDIVAPADDPRRVALVTVGACVSYGAAQPFHAEYGHVRPRNVRARARRWAEETMRDAARVADYEARPVNRIGSTAKEYARGDIDAALHRGPFDTGKNIMRKLHGLPPGEGEA